MTVHSNMMWYCVNSTWHTHPPFLLFLYLPQLSFRLASRSPRQLQQLGEQCHTASNCGIPETTGSPSLQSYRVMDFCVSTGCDWLRLPGKAFLEGWFTTFTCTTEPQTKRLPTTSTHVSPGIVLSRKCSLTRLLRSLRIIILHS